MPLGALVKVPKLWQKLKFFLQTDKHPHRQDKNYMPTHFIPGAQKVVIVPKVEYELVHNSMKFILDHLNLNLDG